MLNGFVEVVAWMNMLFLLYVNRFLLLCVIWYTKTDLKCWTVTDYLCVFEEKAKTKRTEILCVLLIFGTNERKTCGFIHFSCVFCLQVKQKGLFLQSIRYIWLLCDYMCRIMFVSNLFDRNLDIIKRRFTLCSWLVETSQLSTLSKTKWHGMSTDGLYPCVQQ